MTLESRTDADGGFPAEAYGSLKASAALTLRDCDEGVLVFDEKSGKTSLLSHRGGQVLRALCSDHGVDEAAVRVSSGMDQQSDLQEYQALISSLENSGLVIRC